MTPDLLTPDLPMPGATAPLAQLAVLTALGLPLLALAAQLAGGAPLRALSRRLAPFIPLVLLWPALAGADGSLPWSLLGTRFVADETARPLLLLVAVAWSAAGWHAVRSIATDRRWFWTAWFAALLGMNLLLLAGDMASFYLGYVVVSFSGYLLVTQPRSDEAWRAGRVYLVMALAGEAAILVGLLLVASTHGNAVFSELSTNPAAMVDSGARWWLFAGFAVKLGILPLHVWLPLAHPVAPVPASAVLSGVIVKAGLLGWLRFVPAVGDDPPLIGGVLLSLGLVTAFGGVVLGLGQSRLKTVLAYSTISQMGLLLVGFAAVFLSGGEREAAYVVLGVVALHHGLNKAALFLACGCAPGTSRLRLTLFVLPALSLAAAPLTTGFLTKSLLKDAVVASVAVPPIAVVLSLTSTATALLMWKAFQLARSQTAAAQAGRSDDLHPAWPTLVVAALIIPWAYAFATGHAADLLSTGLLGKIVDAVWPLALAMALIVIARRLAEGWRFRVPEGDVIVLLEGAVGRWTGDGERESRADGASEMDDGDAERESTSSIADSAWAVRLLRAEEVQHRISIVGLSLLLIGGLLWLLTLVSGG